MHRHYFWLPIPTMLFSKALEPNYYYQRQIWSEWVLQMVAVVTMIWKHEERGCLQQRSGGEVVPSSVTLMSEWASQCCHGYNNEDHVYHLDLFGGETEYSFINTFFSVPCSVDLQHLMSKLWFSFPHSYPHFTRDLTALHCTGRR